MTEPVTLAWQRITAVLQEHAPATARAIRAPGPADDIRELERIVGLGLPADLLAWWNVTDGVDDRRDFHAGKLIPDDFIPLSVARAREEYVGNADYPDPNCCTGNGEHRLPAGEPVFPYCTALVPVCRSIDGGLLCVDLRPGQDHDCVMTWCASEGAYDIEWPDLTAMLAYVAERLDDHALQRVPDQPESRVIIDDDGTLNWGMAAN